MWEELGQQCKLKIVSSLPDAIHALQIGQCIFVFLGEVTKKIVVNETMCLYKDISSSQIASRVVKEGFTRYLLEQKKAFTSCEVHAC